MNEKTKILVVDDTADTRLLLKTFLEDDYSVTEADSGEACLAQIEQQIPDLILLDVDMPGMSGYDVCKHLRKQKSTEHLPIIFVSSLDSTEERLTGFEVGADEYIIKPIEPEKLISKVQFCLYHKQDMASAKTEAADAMHIAMEAMTVSSELGQIVQFIKDIESYATAEDVGQSILDIGKEFGLNAAVRVKTDKFILAGCEQGSMEDKVLERFTHHSERILSVGIHTIIRNDLIELLIKNMPLDDENRYGRLKDHLAVLLDIANGHLETLEARNAVAKHRKEFLDQIISVAEEQIEKTSQRLHEHHEKSQKIMQSMIIKLEAMLFGLGLEEDQENRLVQLGDETSLKLEEVEGSTEALSTDLGVVLESLYDFLEAEK